MSIGLGPASLAEFEKEELEREQTVAPEGWPVMVANKGRWPLALFYAGYWYVKKSHAEREIMRLDGEKK